MSVLDHPTAVTAVVITATQRAVAATSDDLRTDDLGSIR